MNRVGKMANVLPTRLIYLDPRCCRHARGYVLTSAESGLVGTTFTRSETMQECILRAL